MNDKPKPESTNAELRNSAAPNGQQTDQQNDLYWLAFCYVADELPAEEAASFELRLADDLQAQEALVEVVSMSSSTYQSMVVRDENSKVDVVVKRNADSHRWVGRTKNMWRSIVVLAAGILLIGLSWQYLNSKGTLQNSAQQSVASKAGTLESYAGLESSDLAMWEQTVGMLHDEGVWSSVVGDQLSDEGNDNAQYDAGDSAASTEGLDVDEDLVSLFSSAMSISDISKGEM